MKKILLSVALCGLLTPAFAQKYMTRTGKVIFNSATRIEKIEAINNEAGCVIDAGNGDVVFQVPVKSFRFEKQLMEEHFNENYLESTKFPKAEFRGKLKNMPAADFGKDGTYNVQASGKMTMHGVTREVSAPGTVTVKGGSVTVNAKFKINPKDYAIQIPGLVAGKISENIDVTVNTILAQVKK